MVAKRLFVLKKPKLANSVYSDPHQRIPRG